MAGFGERLLTPYAETVTRQMAEQRKQEEQLRREQLAQAEQLRREGVALKAQDAKDNFLLTMEAAKLGQGPDRFAPAPAGQGMLRAPELSPQQQLLAGISDSVNANALAKKKQDDAKRQSDNLKLVNQVVPNLPEDVGFNLVNTLGLGDLLPKGSFAAARANKNKPGIVEKLLDKIPGTAKANSKFLETFSTKFAEGAVEDYKEANVAARSVSEVRAILSEGNVPTGQYQGVKNKIAGFFKAFGGAPIADAINNNLGGSAILETIFRTMQINTQSKFKGSSSENDMVIAQQANVSTETPAEAMGLGLTILDQRAFDEVAHIKFLHNEMKDSNDVIEAESNWSKIHKNMGTLAIDPATNKVIALKEWLSRSANSSIEGRENQLKGFAKFAGWYNKDGSLKPINRRSVIRGKSDVERLNDLMKLNEKLPPSKQRTRQQLQALIIKYPTQLREQ